MRALAILVDGDSFESLSSSQFYRNVQRRQPNCEADTLAFECLLMALHNVASLNEFQRTEDKYSVVRPAIIAWYYSLYYSSKSMLAAINGSNPEKHAMAGRLWQSDTVDRTHLV